MGYVYTVDIAMCLGDFDGHVGRYEDGFYRTHGGYGVNEKNLQAKTFQELLWRKEVRKKKRSKREEKKDETFIMGEDETEIDGVHMETTPAVSTKYDGN